MNKPFVLTGAADLPVSKNTVVTEFYNESHMTIYDFSVLPHSRRLTGINILIGIMALNWVLVYTLNLPKSFV